MRTQKQPRSYLSLAAKTRNSGGPMHDRRDERGGSRDWEQEWLDDGWEDDRYEEESVVHNFENAEYDWSS